MRLITVEPPRALSSGVGGNTVGSREQRIESIGLTARARSVPDRYHAWRRTAAAYGQMPGPSST
jgi:hypothetical protein